MNERGRLEIIPLGGLGEFGMNMMVYRWGRDCVLVDTGMMFPGAEHLGVDVVIPDTAFLDDCGTLHGIILTHGHEDHIGALPFVLAKHDVPVFSTPFTRGLIRRRLRQHDIAGSPVLQILPEDGPLRLGPFTIEAVPVAHSILQAVMLVLETPVGRIVHTADFKLDPTPPLGPGTDLQRLAAIGRDGVLAVLSDSTNAERTGMTPGEASVVPAIESIVSRARGRVLVATFSSHIPRMQQVIDVAYRHGRKVALVGTSMRAQAEVAESLGLLRIPAESRREPEQCMDLPGNEVLLLTTGTQGEPMSALARIAVDKHRHVFVQDGDVVIHSARIIPGNEKSVNRLVNHLLRRGAEIITAADAPVHVSGHPSGDELKLVLQLLRPKFLIPIHGEYRQLLAHARLAREIGMDSDHIVMAESGDVIALDDDTCAVVDRVHVGQVFLDDSREEVDLPTLKDRRQLAGEGTVVAVVAIDREHGTLSRPPELVTRGFVPEDDEDALLDEAGRVLEAGLADATIEERTDEGMLKARIHADLKRFFRKRTQRRPMIIPLIVEY